MKNADKIINALRKAFPGHAVEYQYKPIANVNSIFIDRVYIGNFDHDFFEADYDNQEIEIKVKAPLKDFINFIDYTYQNETISDVVKNGISEGIIRRAIEKGVREWEEGSQQNS